MTPADPIAVEADRLYRRGLLLYRENQSAEMFRLVTHLWQKALVLYRQIGNQTKIHEIEGHFNRLSRRVLKPVAVFEEDETSAQAVPLRSRAKAPHGFRDWVSFLKVGCLGFGGPVAVLGLLQHELVDRRKVLSHKDFLEAAVLGDTLPGPVTMDIVTYAGYKLRGWWGAFYSTVIFILPSFLLMLLIATHYDRFNSVGVIKNVLHCLGAAVCAIIVSVGVALCKREIQDYFEVAILIFAFMSSLIFKIDMAVTVILSGLAGMLWIGIGDRL
jgi:chromate transporter